MEKIAVDFTPGLSQSVEAGMYFLETANKWSDEYLERLETFPCLFLNEGQVSEEGLPVILFKTPEDEPLYLHSFVMRMKSKTDEMLNTEVSEDISGMLEDLLATAREEPSLVFMAEVYEIGTVFSPDMKDDVKFATLITGGKIRFLATPSLIMVNLDEEGLIGMSIAGVGSYIIRPAA